MNQKRIQKLQENLKKQNITALFVSNPLNVYYLSTFKLSQYKIAQPTNDPEAFLLITQNDCFIFTDARYSETAKKTRNFKFKEIPYPPSPESIAQLIEKLTKLNSTIGFEEDSLLYSDLNKIKNNLKNRETKDASELAAQQRLTKDKNELKLLKETAKITKAGFELALSKLRKGITEKKLAYEITNFFLREAEGNSFPPVVAMGKNSAIPHYETGKTIIETGILLIDLGCVYKGYCGDMTRTVYIGKPSKKFKDIYNVVLKAQKKVLKNIKAGLTGKEADKIARKYITNKGFGKYFTHGTGHGVGLAIHEKPYLRKANETKLKNGMVFSVEPGIYLPGWGGVRIEDIVYLKNGKLINITKTPKELREISFKH